MRGKKTFAVLLFALLITLVPTHRLLGAQCIGANCNGGAGASGAGVVVMYPSGGNDWPRVMAQAAISAPLGQAILLSAGTWHANTALVTPSYSHFIGTPETMITMSLPNSGVNDAAFAMVSSYGTIIAVSTNNTPGTKTVTTATAPGGGWVIGSYVQLMTGGSNLHGSTYQIKGVSGSGPYTLTFDRVVLYKALSATANLRVVTSLVQNVIVEGNGMTVNGSATVAFEVQGALNVQITDVYVDGTSMPSNTSALIFDTYSVNNVARRIRANGAGNFAPVFWMIGETNLMTDCEAYAGAGSGFVMVDSAASVLQNPVAYGNASNGISYASDGSSTGAATVEGNTIVNPSMWGNGVGIDVADGASALTISGGTLQYNGNGIILDNTLPLGSPNNIKIVGVAAINNSYSGVVIESGAKGTVLNSIDVSGNGTYGVQCSDEALISNLVSNGGCPNGVVQAAGAIVTIDNMSAACSANTGSGACLITGNGAFVYATGLRFNMTSTSYVGGIQATGTSRVAVKGMHISFPQQNQGVTLSGTSVVHLDDVSVDGANVGSSVLVNASSGTTVRIGANVHADSAAGPTYNYNSGSHWNRSAIGPGPVTLTGTGGVAVAWPDLQSSDDVIVEVVTAGTSTSPVRVTKNPGTGFTLTGVLTTDNGTVNYVVQ